MRTASLARRAPLLATLAAGGAALAWLTLIQAAGDRLADSDPARALRFDPGHARATARAAEAELEALSPDPRRAAALARRALVLGPLEPTPLRVLAMLEVQRGNETGAHRLMTLAAERSRRDVLAQGWLLERALSQGRYGEVFLRVDVILRQSPDLTEGVAEATAPALSDPRAVEALAARLAAAPPWRETFMRYLIAGAPDVAAPQRVLAAMQARGVAPSRVESELLVSRLVALRRFREAKAAWRAHTPGAAADALVYDGAFRGLPGGPPFNWEPTKAADATVDIAQAPDGTPALYVRYQAAKTTALVGQLLLLEPGAYRLSGRVVFDEPRPGEQLAWTIWCVNAAGEAIAETAQAGDGGGWRSFSTDFVTPAGDCAAQWLGLHSIGQDSFFELGAWYTGLKVERLGPPTVPAQ